MAYCDHAKVIGEINKANDVMTKLRALLLPAIPSNRQSELARDLFQESLQSLTAALSLLQPKICLLVNSINCKDTDDSKSKLGLGGRKGNKINKPKAQIEGRKRRRCSSNLEDCWTSVTSVPHIDGHQWRKYGQKKIGRHKFMRNYYKCTHHEDQQCPARKTVQEQDGNHDPPKYTVCYMMQHTCKIVLDTDPVPVGEGAIVNSKSIKSEPMKKDNEAEKQTSTSSFPTSSSSDNISDISTYNSTIDSFNWEEMMFGNFSTNTATDLYHHQYYKYEDVNGDHVGWCTTNYDGSIWSC